MSRTRSWPSTVLLERLALLALVVFYLATVLPRIADHPIVGGDEGWIISASAKLADHAVFGSDLFAGFYGADQHYYFNLPLHHLVLAGVMKAIGVGIAQARLVSVVYGLAMLVLTWALGRRVGGPAVGILAAALVLLLRLNLTPFTGLTLTDMGAIVRYDLITVPYGLGAALLVSRRRDGPSFLESAAAGLLLGLACVTQFIGAFFVLPLVVFLLANAALPRARRLSTAGVMLLAVVAPVIPYGAYAALHWTDFRGQARAVEQKTDFLSPSFYLDNLRHEPDRYALSTGLRGLPASVSNAFRRPSARLTFYLLAPLAAVYVVVRAWRGSRQHLLLGLLLVGLPLQLALFESTKRFEYWVIVVPFLCLALADGALALWRTSAVGDVQLALHAAVLLVAAGLVVEGLNAAVTGWQDAGSATAYASVGREVEQYVPAGARVMVDNRLWLTLRDRDPRSLLLLFYYTNPRISRDRVTDVRGAMGRIDADYLLLSPLTREILRNLSPRDSADFGQYLRDRASLVGTVPAGDYGPIEVYRLSK